MRSQEALAAYRDLSAGRQDDHWLEPIDVRGHFQDGVEALEGREARRRQPAGRRGVRSGARSGRRGRLRGRRRGPRGGRGLGVSRIGCGVS